MKAKGLSASEVAYMGDDLPDLGALRLAGLATCPNDAVEAVRECAEWIAPLPGGAGAVRHWPILFCSLRVFCLT